MRRPDSLLLLHWRGARWLVLSPSVWEAAHTRTFARAGARSFLHLAFFLRMIIASPNLPFCSQSISRPSAPEPEDCALRERRQMPRQLVFEPAQKLADARG